MEIEVGVVVGVAVAGVPVTVGVGVDVAVCAVTAAATAWPMLLSVRTTQSLVPKVMAAPEGARFTASATVVPPITSEPTVLLVAGVYVVTVPQTVIVVSASGVKEALVNCVPLD
jgi:hypothetical protein